MTIEPREGYLKLIQGMKDLPSIPSAVALAIRVLDDPASTARQVAQAIIHDQSLVTRLLRTVNSAYYGFPRRVDTIDQVITLLGYRAIREMILVTTLFDAAVAGPGPASWNREALWRHAVGCGLAARALARRTKKMPAETVFLAGLLHDIGKVLLDAYLHEEYERVLHMVQTENVPLRVAEEKILGATHADFGHWLAREWNMPEALTAGVMFHHDPAACSDHYILACLVHVGDILARALEIGYGGDDLIPAVNRQAWASLNLTPALLDLIVADILESLDN